MARTAAIASKPSTAPYLLDVNVLIALAWPLHVHHGVAHAWFEKVGHRSWSTCPLTQLAFVRISSNTKIISTAVSPRAAVQALGDMVALAGHVFWPDDLQVKDLASFTSNALVGHRQVTDAYLIELAKRHKGKVATLDAGLADLCPQTERARFVAFIGAV
jgi:toxin-antitoxin system PIN domain toxin